MIIKTVKELKEFLQTVPDDTTITTQDDYYEEAYRLAIDVEVHDKELYIFPTGETRLKPFL